MYKSTCRFYQATRTPITGGLPEKSVDPKELRRKQKIWDQRRNNLKRRKVR